MNFAQISSNKLPAKLKCPTSKSYANRALILGALKKNEIVLLDIPQAQDVKDLLEMLNEVGLEIDFTDGRITLNNSFPACEVIQDKAIVLKGSEGGTTIRFLMILLSLGKNEYHLPLLGELAKRPFKQFLCLLESMGVVISIDANLLKLKGPLRPLDNIVIDCSKTTQVASAFMLVANEFDFTVQLENVSSSKRYLDLTGAVLEHFQTSSEFRVPVDFSSLGYILSYAALNQNICVTNVTSIDNNQADSALIELLQSIGIKITIDEKGLLLTFGDTRFSGFEIDGSTCIDLVPTLVYLASFAKTPSLIKNIKTLKYKESNRLNEILDFLSYLQIKSDYRELEDQLKIYPFQNTKNKNLCVRVAPDHRIVMMASLFIKQMGGGSVYPSESVCKSFPHFFELFT